jgi:hypothetical protein
MLVPKRSAWYIVNAKQRLIFQSLSNFCIPLFPHQWNEWLVEDISDFPICAILMDAWSICYKQGIILALYKILLT